MSTESFFSRLPDAVIFDLDGVLVDTEVIYRTAWQAASAKHSYRLQDELFSCMVGRTYDEIRGILFEHYGSSFPFDEIYSLRVEIFTRHLTEYGVTLKEGVAEILDELKRLGIACAISTGSPPELACEKLRLAKVASLFDIVECEPKSACGQPNPKGYLRALGRLATNLTNTIAIEDSESGTRAALAAGLRVLVVPDLARIPTYSVHDRVMVIPSLFELRTALIGCNTGNASN